ncbi:indole-3-glycerol phosphate synthase TrpC [Ammoniphilus sp. YIM 78166]|uniref:indole-3-glycerol phosphate synthase TrpC n=1 Tax=Ammoniphilus sp. YIM 78166 TaxID=1644106 RepID=UPI00106F5AD0|nr:indole-3-glycerol phosphate synthase TrpC [Ammoniphilus sp. YIM 78166]
MLDKIVATKLIEIEQLKQEWNQDEMERQIAELPPTRSFINRLVQSQRSISVIAEVKKASPSKGLIRQDFDPLAIAKAYDLAGVDAMSVLTDVDYFQGSNTYLTEIRKQTNTPIIRKDFIIDPLQVYEARRIGADCILLIAAILSSQQLEELSSLADRLGLDVLIEIHNKEELELVLASTQPRLIGINNRNLKTFETSLQTTEELLPFIPNSLPVVSESGIHSADDIRYLRELGRVRAVLVGEHFMRKPDIAAAVEELVGS